MALIRCSECGKDVSDKATACPNCGAPIGSERGPQRRGNTPVRATVHLRQQSRFFPETVTRKQYLIRCLIVFGVVVAAWALAQAAAQVFPVFDVPLIVIRIVIVLLLIVVLLAFLYLVGLSIARRAQHPSGASSSKRILPAFLLCFFFGGLAVHRFYCGRSLSGLLMLGLGLIAVISTLKDNAAIGAVSVTILAIWVLVDFITIIVGGMTDGNNCKIDKWT